MYHGQSRSGVENKPKCQDCKVDKTNIEKEKKRERKLRMWETIWMNNVKDFQTSGFMSKHKKNV